MHWCMKKEILAEEQESSILGSPLAKQVDETVSNKGKGVEEEKEQTLNKHITLLDAYVKLYQIESLDRISRTVYREQSSNDDYEPSSAASESISSEGEENDVEMIEGEEDSVAHKTGVDKRHQCRVCSKRFLYSCRLKRHMLTHTKEKAEKRHQCTVCTKRFPHTGDLNVHMRSHTKEKPYECTVCTKKFSVTGHLKRHMLIHTNKSHQCTMCTKRFRCYYDMINHMRIHTNEKHHQCTVCTKRFIMSGDLTKHMRTHTKDKPYHCTVCNEKFSVSSNLRRHFKRIHAK
ncbi:zinc finger protein 271 isoform X3 [Nilaparvata lugens]|nr:zinc finger protein 271 isoform X3 [Nilaparvata lugens]